ncbi:MAG: DUF2065 domain-containing protein [Burkholderiales bacterium]
MGSTILMAVGLALVIEGLLPFVNPPIWRDMFTRIAAMNDGQIRTVGFASILAGLVLFLAAS